jgi:hypothetical protein
MLDVKAMEPTESVFVIILFCVNLAAGFGFSVPIAVMLRELAGKQRKFFSYFALLVGIYFVESVAFAFGMGTQIFSIGLAFVWGLFLGLWLRGKGESIRVLKTSFLFSLYTCIPTVSFAILILAAKLMAGANLVSSEQGIAFGIPYFVPRPLNTILDFCAALTIGTIAFKTAITTGGVSFLIHLGEKDKNS